MREGLNLQFRAELFNLLNHANFNIAERGHVHSGGVAHGGADHQHLHHLAADSIRPETALVG